MAATRRLTVLAKLGGTMGGVPAVSDQPSSDRTRSPLSAQAARSSSTRNGSPSAKPATASLTSTGTSLRRQAVAIDCTPPSSSRRSSMTRPERRACIDACRAPARPGSSERSVPMHTTGSESRVSLK